MSEQDDKSEKQRPIDHDNFVGDLDRTSYPQEARSHLNSRRPGRDEIEPPHHTKQ
jgi:hypothetical protein